MMVQTWPAARKPWTRLAGDDRMAAMAGGTSTCDTSKAKFVSPRRFACHTAVALAGAVVSKPTAKKTTTRSGFCSASRRQSSGE